MVLASYLTDFRHDIKSPLRFHSLLAPLDLAALGALAAHERRAVLGRGVRVDPIMCAPMAG